MGRLMQPLPANNSCALQLHAITALLLATPPNAGAGTEFSVFAIAAVRPPARPKLFQRLATNLIDLTGRRGAVAAGVALGRGNKTAAGARCELQALSRHARWLAGALVAFVALLAQASTA